MEWTDDMRVRQARGTTTAELVRYLRQAGPSGVTHREVLGVLTERFALSFEDARVAVDRVGGGVVRAAIGNPANEPDPVKDPIAWTSYRMALGLPLDVPATSGGRASLRALWGRARSKAVAEVPEPTDVDLALEAVDEAVALPDDDPARSDRLREAALALSEAADACQARVEAWGCAPEGSQEWVDGVALAAAARRLSTVFAALGRPDRESWALALAARIATRLHGRSRAHVGRAMLDYADCLRRHGDVEAAMGALDAVVADFALLVDEFSDEDPFDEHVLALEHLATALDLLTQLRGPSSTIDDLRRRTAEVLGRGDI